MKWSWVGRYLLAVCSAVGVCAVQAGEPALPPALLAQVQNILRTSETDTATVLLVDGLGISGALRHGSSECLAAGAAGDGLVALLAMRLAEQGKVDLYAPLPAIKNLASQCKIKLTISHLLEHTSGVSGSSGSSGACSGVQTIYKETDAKLAAAALEKSTRTSMARLMQRELFKPLGMTASSWGSVKSACRSINPTANTLVTTPQDMAKVVHMLVQRGQVDGRTYLPQCSVERMGISVSAVSTPGGNTPLAISKAQYGFGLERFDAGGLSWLGYIGTLPGSQWVWAYSSQSQSGMIILLPAANAKTLAALKFAVAKHLQQDAVLLTQR